jgi:hypothetical protein
MRRLLFAVSLVGLISLPFASAAQRAGGGAAAPTGGIHAVPMHVGPSAAPHAQSSHPAPHSSLRTGVRTGTSPTRSSVARSVGHNVPAPRSAWNSALGLPPSSIAPIPSSLAYVSSVPTLLPGSAFFGRNFYGYGYGRNCLSGFGCFGPGRFSNGGVIIPWGFGGGFYLPTPYYEPGPDDQGPPPPPVDAYGPDQNGNNQQAAAEQLPQPPAAAPYYPPSEPVYEYVFVKRDGTKIFAVAYSLTKDNVQYVTKEGLRRTIPLSSLDFDATQKSNEERGNTINLPAPPPAAMAMAS